MSLAIAFFSTHTPSVDFPSKSVGSGARLQDSLCFLPYNQSWNSQVHMLLKLGASTLIIRGTFTHFKPMFPCRNHAVQGGWTKHTYHMCVLYILPKFPRFVSVSRSNILVQHVNFVVYLEVTLKSIFFSSRSREGILFPPSFLHHCSKRPITFTKCFSVLLRVHGGYMSARVNYHLHRNILFFFFQWGLLVAISNVALKLNSQGNWIQDVLSNCVV